MNSGSTQTGVTIGRRPSTATRNSKSIRPSPRNSSVVTTATSADAARIHGVRSGGTTARAAPAMARLTAHSGAASGALISKTATTMPHSGSVSAQTVAGSRM